MKPETAKALAELARAAYIHQYGFEPADGEITFAVCGTEKTMNRSSCMCCRRPLSDPKSMIRGLGPICAAKIEAEQEDKCDLPFNPDTMDIICQRDADGTTHFNIFQVFKYHSPTGMEWGYSGSGPADFALNILAMFLHGGPTIKIGGQHMPKAAWELHQRFKDSILFGSLPREKGGMIKGKAIRKWLRTMMED